MSRLSFLVVLAFAVPAACTADAPDLPNAPYLEKQWAQPNSREAGARVWTEKQAVPALEQRGQAVLPALYPLGVGDNAIFRSHWGIHAVNLRTGKLAWEADARLGLDRLLRDRGTVGAATRWVTAFSASDQPDAILENSTLGTLSTDGRRVFAIEDLAVAPGIPRSPYNEAQAGTLGPILQAAVHHSRLQAYDLTTGKLVWELGGPEGQPGEDATDLTGSFFLAAPLVLDRKLYVLNEKAANLRLLCLEPDKGTLHWTQHLASFRIPLNQDPLRRRQAALLAHADGVLVCPTNTGVLLGFELRTRTILWAHPYREQRPSNPVSDRPVEPRSNAPFLGFHWRVTSPFVHAGNVVYAAPDGLSVVCLRLRDGSLVWETRPTQEDLYLAGILPAAAGAPARLVIVGKKSCRALGLADGKLLWNLETGMPSGRGSAEGVTYFLPLKVAAGTREPAVWAIDTAQGQVVARTRSQHGDVPGNLYFHAGMVLSQNVAEMAGYPQVQTKLAAIDALLGKDPGNAAGLTERAGLRLNKGDVQGAIDDVHAALASPLPLGATLRARRVLYEALTELLRRDFPAGEKYLAEYEPLCNVEVPANATPEERGDLERERQRRRATYLARLARGREEQGRLIAALQAYLDLAAAGGDDLVSMQADPVLRVRRSLWANGRINALLAGATPEQHRQLDAEIASRWAVLLAGNGRAELEAFVRAFGGTAIGCDAKLLLAARLGKEKAFLQAEGLLLQVRQSAERTQSARATEALASLYADRWLLPDAVSACRALADLGPRDIVRDGKSGPDLFHDMTSDKRFLPFLEEPGPLAAGRVQVRIDTGNFTQDRPLFSFDPEGEALPWFRQQRVALNLGSHQLEVLDLQTDSEWKLPLPQTNFANFVYQRNALQPFLPRYQTLGHLVVLNVGHLVVGIDPIDRRLLWEKNLLGPVPAPGIRNVIPDPRDGTPQIIYQDGWIQKLGQVAAVDAAAACVQTRDGLVALDSVTGSLLWSRSDVPMRSQFFGSDGHLFVVEQTIDDHPSCSRVLRIADGTAVAVPDFAALYARRLAVVGHNLLLSRKGPGSEVELYLHNTLTGKVEWRRVFPAGSFVLRSEAPDLSGTLDPEGWLTIVDLRARAEVLHVRFDAGLLGRANEVHLLRDRANFYLACPGMPLPPGVGNLGPFPNALAESGLHGLRVNGRVYAFDRLTGKRRWEAEVSQQFLLLNQFADLPVLIFTSSRPEAPVGNGSAAVKRALKIIDKRTGKLLFDEASLSTGAPFHGLIHRQPGGRIELVSSTMKINIIPDK